MEDCLFCKIINNQIPATKIYEDDKIIAFLDINPVNPGHALVVPKEHFENFLSISDEIAQELVVVMKKIAKAATEALNLEGFNIEQNNGLVAGQIVPHLHFHIVPRHKDDGLRHWPGKSYQEGEMEEIAKKIKSKI